MARIKKNPGGLDAATFGVRQKEQILAYLDEKLRSISWSKAQCAERENKAEEAHQSAAVLPHPAVLDKILRYETKLERQLYRAINQLERLQRMRRGEAGPPPLTMEVSDRS
jgi:hypothetical protein